MARAVKGSDLDYSRIVLGLLESVERNGNQSQRRLAEELGIALGLVNLYLKRCAAKGLIKMKQAPARRFAYYLTPYGFAEKSRLTVEYLSYSLSFFRRARCDCTAIVAVAANFGWKRIALAGVSDLAEIAVICAIEGGVEIVGVIDGKAECERFVNLPVVPDLAAMGSVDGVIVTDMVSGYATFAAIAAAIGRDRVLAPSLLGIDRGNARVFSND